MEELLTGGWGGGVWGSKYLIKHIHIIYNALYSIYCFDLQSLGGGGLLFRGGNPRAPPPLLNETLWCFLQHTCVSLLHLGIYMLCYAYLKCKMITHTL